MSFHPSRFIDPAREQVSKACTRIAQSVSMLMNEIGMGGWGFTIVFWQKDNPVSEDRLMVVCPPDTDTQQLDDALRVCREQLQLRRTDRN